MRPSEAGDPLDAGGRAEGPRAQAVQVHDEQRSWSARRGEPAQSRVHGRRAQSALGRRHHRVYDWRERQTVCGGNSRSLLAVCRGLGDQRSERPAPRAGGAHAGAEPAVPGDGAAPSLRSWVHVCERRLPAATGRVRHQVQHEPDRRLLRQRRDGSILLDAQDGARRWLRDPRPGQARAVRVHRRVLQHTASALDASLRESGGVRAALPRRLQHEAVRVIQTMTGDRAIEKPLRMPQERFHRGAGYSGIPSLRPHASSTKVLRLSMWLKMFAPSKTMWTLPPLWTQRTRPQGFGNLAKSARFPQRPHRLLLSWKRKERRTKTAQTNCPRTRIIPKKVPSRRRAIALRPDRYRLPPVCQRLEIWLPRTPPSGRET